MRSLVPGPKFHAAKRPGHRSSALEVVGLDLFEFHDGPHANTQRSDNLGGWTLGRCDFLPASIDIDSRNAKKSRRTISGNWAENSQIATSRPLFSVWRSWTRDPPPSCDGCSTRSGRG